MSPNSKNNQPEVLFLGNSWHCQLRFFLSWVLWMLRKWSGKKMLKCLNGWEPVSTVYCSWEFTQTTILMSNFLSLSLIFLAIFNSNNEGFLNVALRAESTAKYVHWLMILMLTLFAAGLKIYIKWGVVQHHPLLDTQNYWKKIDFSDEPFEIKSHEMFWLGDTWRWKLSCLSSKSSNSWSRQWGWRYEKLN